MTSSKPTAAMRVSSKVNRRRALGQKQTTNKSGQSSFQGAPLHLGCAYPSPSKVAIIFGCKPQQVPTSNLDPFGCEPQQLPTSNLDPFIGATSSLNRPKHKLMCFCNTHNQHAYCFGPFTHTHLDNLMRLHWLLAHIIEKGAELALTSFNWRSLGFT